MANIYGTWGNDTLVGTIDGDYINGFAGDDLLLGLPGDDSRGSDTLDGGEGIDYASLRFDPSTSGINFSVADNLVGAVQLPDGTVLSSIEKIDFTGSNFADSLAGGIFNDRLFGNGGDDTLQGGDGNDLLEGGEGMDSLAGEAGDDTLGSGSDTSGDDLNGGEGIDFAFVIFHASTTGINFSVADNLVGAVQLPDGTVLSSIEKIDFTGSNFADSLAGGIFNDRLFGNGGNDTLLGGDGNDRLASGEGLDSLEGGAGDDTIGHYYRNSVYDDVWDSTRGDTLDGGDGTDRAFVDCSASPTAISFAVADNLAASVTLADGTVLSDIEWIYFRGSPAADSLEGGLLDDFLNGWGGYDTLDGGGGNDTLHGGGSISGGDGNDALYVWGGENNVYSGGDGNDIFFFNGRSDGHARSVTGGAGDDTLGTYETSGYGGADWWFGEFWSDTSGAMLDGGDGTDWATVDEHDSTMGISFAVADILAGPVRLADGTVLSNIERINFRGSPAADSLVGGLLGDRLHGEEGHDTLNGGTGIDTLAGDSGKDSLLGGWGEDWISGGTGRDALFGDAGADTLLGGSGADRLVGGWGPDQLSGHEDSDRLWGGGGNDSLAGGFGNDTLDGDGGSDMLRGGAGADVFVFNSDSDGEASHNTDTITGFASGTDTIRLGKGIFDAIPVGVLAPEQFRSGDGSIEAEDSDDRIIYNTTTGVLYYDSDGTGATEAVQFAVLGTTTHPGITAADFTIVG